MSSQRRIVTVADLPDLPAGAEFLIPYDTVLTPLARDEAARRGLKLRETSEAEARAAVSSGKVRSEERRVGKECRL